MPLIKMETSVSVSDSQKSELALALSKIVAEATSKPEQYVMAVVSEAAISMAGEMGPAAFLQICSIGALNREVNTDISRKTAALLEKSINIPIERVYLSFNDVSAVNWGWNGRTFG